MWSFPAVCLLGLSVYLLKILALGVRYEVRIGCRRGPQGTLFLTLTTIMTLFKLVALCGLIRIDAAPAAGGMPQMTSITPGTTPMRGWMSWER